MGSTLAGQETSIHPAALDLKFWDSKNISLTSPLPISTMKEGTYQDI